MKAWLCYGVASIALSVLPCHAATLSGNDYDWNHPVQMVVQGVPTTVIPVKKKQPFAVKHPKLHNAGRKIRRTCTVLLPVVEFCGALAQVGTYLR